MLTWYVDDDLTEDEREDLLAAGSMVIGDFPDDFDLDERFVEVSDRTALLPTAGTWIVLQRGFTTL